MNAMHMTLRSLRKRAVALAVIMVFPQWAAAASDPFAGMHALRDAQLDQLRGGFDTADGLHFSFAVERAVTINGDIVATTRLVLTDLSALLSGTMPNVDILQSTRTLVQSGGGNTVAVPPAALPSTTAAPPVATPPSQPVTAASASTVSPPVAPAATASVPTAPATASAVQPTAVPVAAAGTSPSVTPASIAGDPRAASAPLVVQVNAGGQTLVLPNASAIVTAVQNSVNNQIIQTRTTIDAMLSTLSAARAGALADSIRQQALDAARR